MSAVPEKKRDPTIKKRMTEYDERNAEKGITPVKVRIPKSRRAELLDLCAKWRAEAGE